MIVQIEVQRAQDCRTTILPFGHARYWIVSGDPKHQAVNNWLPTSRLFGAVMNPRCRGPRSTDRRARLSRAYNRGDHLHPHDGGEPVTANAIYLGAARQPPRSPRSAKTRDDRVIRKQSRGIEKRFVSGLA